jgi:hypothetical protein
VCGMKLGFGGVGAEGARGAQEKLLKQKTREHESAVTKGDGRLRESYAVMPGSGGQRGVEMSFFFLGIRHHT